MAVPRSRFPAYPPDLPQGLQLYLEAIRKEISILGVSGGATIQISEGGAPVSTGANILDFFGSDFDVVQSPPGEVNIAISSGISRVGHTHAFTDITAGVATKAQLPASIAYEDEANTFTLAQRITGPAGTLLTIDDNATGGVLTFSSDGVGQTHAVWGGSGAIHGQAGQFQIIATAGLLALNPTGGLAVTIGTDPAGTRLLRAGGGFNFKASDADSFLESTAGTLFTPQFTVRGNRPRINFDHNTAAGAAGTLAWLQAGVAQSHFFYDTSAQRWIFFDGGAGVNAFQLSRDSGGAWSPGAAGRATLGTATLPWGDTHIGQTLWFRPSGIAQAAIHSPALNELHFANSGGNDLAVLSQTLLDLSPGGSGVDLRIGTLGRFDSTDAPTEGQTLIYKTGAINKWQAESLNAIWGDTDFKAAILPDGAVTYIFFDPGAGADSPAGNPPTPGALTVTQQHGTHTIELRDYAKPADFRQFAWEYSKNGTDWIALASTTSPKVVHSRLPFDGTTFRYRVYVIDRAANQSPPSAVAGPFTPLRTGETHAFGAVIAGEIAVANLAAITATMGILTSGQIRGPGNIHGINFSGAGGIPGTWVSGINFENTAVTGMTRYINFNSTAHNNFIKTERLTIGHDGTVEMYQTSAQPLFKLNGSDFLLQNDAASPTQGLLIDGSLPGSWTRYFNLNGSGQMIHHDLFELHYDGSMKMMKKVIFLTSGTSWTVPADFNPFLNSIELIGGGGGGVNGQVNTRGGGGGGGGGYSRIIAFNPGNLSSVPYAIGAGGSPSVSGGQTSWNSGTTVANGGGGASGATGGTGGTGNVFNGGNGGNGFITTGNAGGGGAGGAGGLNSAGGNGVAAGIPGGDGGAGGGPNGGTAGVAGNPGTAGGNGTAWTANPGGSTAGSGGGGGGGNSGANGGAGGNYGGGGGGGGSTAAAAGTAGSGIQGIIVITYFPIGAL